MTELGRWIVITGVILIVVGALVMLAGRVPGVGRLPGDIVWRKGNFTLFAPLGTMLVVSVVLTIILSIIARWMK